MDSSAVEGRRPRFLTKTVEAAQSKARGPGGGSWRSETFRPGPRRQGTNRKLEGDGLKLQVSDQKRAVSDPNFKFRIRNLKGRFHNQSVWPAFRGCFFCGLAGPGGTGQPSKRQTAKTNHNKKRPDCRQVPSFSPRSFLERLSAHSEAHP